MQTLVLDSGALIKANQWFGDSGQPARYALIAGHSTLIAEGSPPAPMVGWRKDTEAVFFRDGTLVTDPKVIDTHPGIPKELKPVLTARVVAQAEWSPHSVAELPPSAPVNPAVQAEAKAQAKAAQTRAKLQLEPGRVLKTEPLPAE
jgi:hypothetical protein